MKILIIDDEKVPSETLQLTIEREIPGATVLLHNVFESAFERVESEMPDAVILDVFLGDERPGSLIQQQLWEKHFCPLVIYTARFQEVRQVFPEHSFIRCCDKLPKNSDRDVINHLKSFHPHVETLRTVRRQALQSIGESLRDVCTVIWEGADDDTERSELIGRITKRRVAASMDAAVTEDGSLYPWEQFVYPPVSHSLLTGDVIHASQTNDRTPENFRIIISPSCDLVRRKGCLEMVLVACCENVDSFLRATTLGDAKLSKVKDRLPSLLTVDQIGGVLCLPKLPSVLPVMAVNLKNLELIPIDDIALEKSPHSKFHRVASVDSPFRERIAFAFSQVSSRPGLPDIDVGKMTEMIIAQITAQRASSGGSDAQSS